MFDNQIVDIYRLTLPPGLGQLDLNNNQIVEASLREGIKDVSRMRLDEGLTRLRLYGNQIVDVSGLPLPSGLTHFDLENN